MGSFPKTELEIVALAEEMIEGFVAYSEDFPSGDPTGLQTTLNTFRQYREEQSAAERGAKTATVSKNEQLDALVEKMKTALKRAEANVAASPEKLGEIGWSSRQTPAPVSVPGAPSALIPVAEGQGMICLKWTRPESGGSVRNYIIERRQEPAGGGSFGAWTYVDTCYNCEITVTGQPSMVKLEYRVLASNIRGESAPSNAIPAFLP